MGKSTVGHIMRCSDDVNHKTVGQMPTYCAAVRLTFDLLSWKNGTPVNPAPKKSSHQFWFFCKQTDRARSVVQQSVQPHNNMETDREKEIGGYLPISREQDRVRLDISVYDAIGMEEGKCLEACLANCCYLLLIHSATQPLLTDVLFYVHSTDVVMTII